MTNLLAQDISRDSISAAIDRLIRKYHDLPEFARAKLSEQDVRDYFITPLLEALGWGTVDPRERVAEKHLPRKGFSDYELCLPLASDPVDPYIPVLYVEAKKFGDLSPLETDLFGRERRSEADRQVIEYADVYNLKRAEKIGWGILTNFEFFRLWDTRRNVLVESTEWFNELKRERTLEILYRLSRNEAERDPSFHSLHSYRKLPDIDEKFLAKLNEWRANLAHAIWRHPSNRPKLGAATLDQQARLRDVVQRTLDRLIVIRTAEDRGLLPPPLRLQEMIRNFGGPDAVPLMLLNNIQNNTFRYFDQNYNSKLFGQHLADDMQVHNNPLTQIIEQMCKVSFDSMNADILGATYEQYLGQTIEIDIANDMPTLIPNSETRHAQGSYYTPRHVVQHIVDETVGIYLYGTDNGQPNGIALPGRRRRTLAEIQDLTVLDPACGSGSFLIYAFDVLFEFYSGEKRRLDQLIEQRLDDAVATGVPRLAAAAQHDPEMLSLLAQLHNTRFAHARIIERHLYGVDLDPQAAEVASMNLLLKALTRGERLPRILGDNVKIGNSLISGMKLTEISEDLINNIGELRALRQQIHLETLLASENADDRSKHEQKIEGLEQRVRAYVAPLNLEINKVLKRKGAEGWFDDPAQKRPFNWQLEFPEVFLPEGERKPKFTFVLGNPPYVGFHGFAEDKPFLRDTYSTASGKFDIYVPFIERGIALTADSGELSFICPSTFMKRGFGRRLRQFLLSNTSIESIHDFLHTKVFRDALNYTCIPRLRSQPPELTHVIQYSEGPALVRERRKFQQSKLTDAPWVFRFGDDEVLVEKVRTGANFKKLSDLTKGVAEGIVTACNAVLLISSEDVARLNLEKTFLKPCIRGEDVKRFAVTWGGFYVFYPYVIRSGKTEVIEEQILIDLCPNLYRYLVERRNQLQSRHYFEGTSKKWFELWCQRDMRLQQGAKIIVPELADRSQFAHVGSEFFYVDTTCGISPKDVEEVDIWYMLAALNSRVGEYLYRKTTVPKANGFLIYKTMYLSSFPIPLPRDEMEREFVERISDSARCIQQHNNDIAVLEEAFDRCLTATLPIMTSDANFYRDYYSIPEYWKSRRLIPEQALDVRDTVAAIRIDNETHKTLSGQRETNLLILSYQSEPMGPWKPLIELEPSNADLKLFLLLTLRRFIERHARKKWKLAKAKNSRTVDVVLNSLVAPMYCFPYGSNGFETNMRKVSELVHTFRQNATGEVNPCVIEATRNAVDNEVDAAFFELYQLSEKEKDLVRNEIVR